MHVRKLIARWHQPASLVALVVLLAAATVGVAGAARAQRPTDPASVSTLRALVGHYRSVAWTFERAASRPRERSSFTERRTKDRRYLRFAIDLWTRRAYAAQSYAIRAIHRRLAVALPKPPGMRAPLTARVRYSRRLTIALRTIYPGKAAAARRLAGAVSTPPASQLRLWQRRSALAALDVSRHAVRHARIPGSLEQAFLCIHRYEASWDANTGNGYYGGLQMDLPFQSHYGPEYVAQYGTADRWPVWVQLEVATRAYRDAGGFWPWPNTARVCGLL
ncbi:MAG TPA: transglycosylase family protein [Gaiellaceae bacterium]|nr:transglycosylase family protein [Gaiellaceae bacterium]